MYQPVRYYDAPRQHSIAPLCMCCFALLIITIVGVGLVPLVMSENFSISLLFSTVDDAEISLAFDKFVNDYSKAYETPEEREKRLEVFAGNYKRIVDFNNKNGDSLTLGVNQFADLNEEEFEQMYLKYPTDNPQCTVAKKSFLHFQPPQKTESTFSPEINWIEKGKVLPVKDQGSCGSCWTFAATSTIEILYAIRENLSPPNLVRMSEQQLVDCCTTTQSHGCSGGIVGEAFDYAKDKGLARSADYPYHAMNEDCKDGSVKPVYKLDGYKNITAGDVDEMEKMIMDRSIAIGVAAGYFAFRFYKSGVVDRGCPDYPINHGVAIVGAGNEGGKDYWLVRNSWGGNWGANGYIKIARRGPGMGYCAISACPQIALYKEKA